MKTKRNCGFLRHSDLKPFHENAFKYTFCMCVRERVREIYSDESFPKNKISRLETRIGTLTDSIE